MMMVNGIPVLYCHRLLPVVKKLGYSLLRGRFFLPLDQAWLGRLKIYGKKREAHNWGNSSSTASPEWLDLSVGLSFGS